MKKALALILGITFIFTTIPFISAFADSDPGFSNLVMNHSFSWYSDFPYVDTNGFIYNSYLQSATLVSNGVTSHPSPNIVPTLYQDGDYFEVSFDSDILSGYQTPLWNVLIAYDSSTYSSHYDIPNDSIICYLNNELAFYEFQTNLTMENRKWRCISFICQGNYLESTTIKIEYDGDGTPIQIPITMICFRGYRFTPSGSLTTQEMIELQSNIVNALNTARLADLIDNLDTSDLDLTSLENTTASILQKLASVPDIIQYIDQIETIDSNILSAINNFFNYYSEMYMNLNNDTTISVKYYDNQGNLFDSSTSFSTNDLWVVIPLNKNIGILRFQLYLYAPDNHNTSAYVYKNDYSVTSRFMLQNIVDIYENVIFGGNTNTLYILDYFIPNDYDYNSYLYLHYTFDTTKNIYPYSYTNKVFTKSYSTSWYQRIELYLKQLLGYSNSDVTDSVDYVNDTVADQIDDITSFEDTYNQSLDTSASQIDISSYQITQTSGMSWMRTYTEYNFDQMQNFRILFITPLILALAAFFLRRKQ